MKFCSKCGAQLNDDARFCPACGEAQETPYVAEPQQSLPQQSYHQPYQQATQQSAEPYNQQQAQPRYQQQAQPGYQQPEPHMQYQQPYSRPQRPVKVNNGPNPVEQSVVNFADRYCGYGSLGWAMGLCILSLVLLIFYNGPLLNFSGVLRDISYKIEDVLPLWLVIDIMQLSLLYMFMHLVNALYKAGGSWPLLYITPCVWLITMVLFTVLCLTQNFNYDESSNIQSLLLASYVCVGIVGILCAKIDMFSWTGKVLIIAVICWIVSEVSSTMIPFIFFGLGTLWYIFEINSRVRHFFNDYYYAPAEDYLDNTAYMG